MPSRVYDLEFDDDNTEELARHGVSIEEAFQVGEFELGEELVDVERRSPAGAVLSIRLSQDELCELQRIAKARGLTVTEFARAALVGVVHSGGADIRS